MEITTIVKRQKKFYHSGKTLPYGFRMAALKRLEIAVSCHEKEIAEALRQDLNKAPMESYMTETGLILSEIRYLMRHLKEYMEPEKVHTPLAHYPARSFVISEPYGTVLIMSPWNYPFMLCLEPLAGAIAAGNCCVVKPSAYAPACSAVIKRMIKDVFPSHYVAVVEGGRNENTELLDERFDYIFFTGGTAVGRLVMEKAAVNITPVTLELGGKSPCIVDHTADLCLAAKRIVFGKFLNGGQTCVAPDYVLVEQSVEKEFLGNVSFWIRKMLGDEPLSHPDYPKVVNRRHFDRLKGLMEGEEIWSGGQMDEGSLQIAPTVLWNVRPDAPVMQEEIFGPLLPVLTFQGIAEAEEFVRGREKPLALYLFTGSGKTEERILKNLSFGGGCINDTIIHLATSRMGFGGVGGSGMGSYHGYESFRTFSHYKSIVKKGAMDLPVRYRPYTKLKEIVLKFVLK